MKRIGIVLCLGVLSLSVVGQDLTDYSTKVQRKAKAIEVANDRGVFIRKELPDGTIIELQDIDASGRLIYYKTLNAESARTTGTNKLYQGSSLGLSLSGNGMTIGMWDGGSIQANHVEFAGRFQQLDNPTGKSQHSTHVLGTLLATGVNPEARGMAYNAFGAVYDFNIDDPEMDDAASNGLLISNHSYGEVLGWQYDSDKNAWEWQGNAEISATEDYRFGLYSSASVSWDKIEYENPYYLIVKSAGNDRSDVGNGTGAPADGPFDIIDPHGVAKNILTVGAVNPLDNYTGPADVKITNFSSWGPTDDGRIKPDLTGMGANVLSTSSTGASSYATLSGTSMSSPNVAGSLLLLQELYNDRYGDYMLSSTLKGLAIHTALEAGNNPGPDYSYGWGLLSTDDAARQILLSNGEDFLLEEHELFNTETFEKTIDLREGIPASFTICWTDVPGQPNGTVLNPTNLALVNDLDMRIISPGGDAMTPWVMNPSSHNASRGDNFRDNVEKIDFTPATSGTYTILISHKETLSSGKQTFSLIASAASPSDELRTLYYIGGDGQWDKPSNWSLSSGGSSANRVPNKKDVVIIGNNKTVNLTADASCMAVATTGGQGGTLNLTNHTLQVASHITLNNASQIKNGTLLFSNPGNLTASTIEAGSTSLNNIKLELNAPEYTLNLNSDLNVKSIVVGAGTLNMGDHTYDVTNLEFNGTSSKVWMMDGSHVQISGRLFVQAGLDLEMFDSELISDGTETIFEVETAPDLPFSIVKEETGSLELRGSVVIEELEQNGKLTFNGNPVITNWKVKQDVTFANSANSQQVLVKGVMTVDHSAKPGLINFTADSPDNTIQSDNSNKFCFDGINVQNISVTGNTKFVVDDASSLANAPGWIQAPCASVLASDFTYQFACVSGITEFSDISDGQPVSWEWDFGDNTSGSTEKDPQHVFQSTGEYDVTLVVESSGGETSEYTKVVTVGTTTLNLPQVVESGTGLRSTAFANSYQWYVNDEPIEGANDFALEGPLDDGIYAIEISNNSCKLRSEDFFYGITAVDDDLPLFNMYPNPTSGILHIQMTDKLVQSIRVIDQQGRKLREYTERSGPLIELDLHDLKAGIYYLLLRSQDVTTVRRVVKK